MTSDLAAFKKLKSEGDLAAFFGLTKKQLRFYLYSSSRPRYRHFSIRKASGGVRAISAPPIELESFQRKILACLKKMVVPKEACHGFSEGKSIASNARAHVGKKLILNLDLEDFFPSIHFGRVFGTFRKNPFNFPREISALLAHICCYAKKLPQGAPTSPLISNLICRGLDRDLERLALNHDCRYTRYADDMTFSTIASEFPKEIVSAWPRGTVTAPILGVDVCRLIAKHDFRINGTKTRLSVRSQRQEVTGLVVNAKLNVRRELIRSIRSALHDIRSKGDAAAQTRFENTFDSKDRLGPSPSLKRHLSGKMNFVGMIRGRDDPLFTRLALRAQRDIGFCSQGLPIFGRSGSHDFWKECVWVVVVRDAGGVHISNGTAFVLKGVGFVSAAHVFDPVANGFIAASWELRLASNPFVAFPIQAIKKSAPADLAILRTAAPPVGCLQAATGPPVVMSNITVVGFPNWNTPADHLLAHGGSVTQLRPVGGITYVLTSVAVRGGNSGGPILDESGFVAGIVLGDAQHAASPNGGALIGEIKWALASPEVAL